MCSALLALPMIAAPRQQKRIDPNNIPDLIYRVKKNEFVPQAANLLAQAQATEAIPVLKQQFDAISDTHNKEAIASALVRLGDKEEIYWDFLVKQSKRALENDAPFPTLFDSSGRTVKGQLSPEFEAWAKANKLSPTEAAYNQVYVIPGDFYYLAKTGDSRGRVLLRTAMSSRNYMVQITAAKGLAKLKDNDSIPLIIQNCEKAPSEVAGAIAWALPFFDDPRAQRAAERFITNQKILDDLRKLKHENGDKGIDKTF